MTHSDQIDKIHVCLGGITIFSFLLGFSIGVTRSSVLIHNTAPLILLAALVIPITVLMHVYVNMLQDNVRGMRKGSFVITRMENFMILCVSFGHALEGILVWRMFFSLWSLHIPTFFAQFVIFMVVLFFTAHKQVRLAKMFE